MARVESPTTLLRAELSETIRMQRRVRRLLNARLNVIESAMRDRIAGPRAAEGLSEELITIMDSLNKSIETSAKLIVVRGAPDESSTAGVADILEELSKGTARPR